jgi:hypothetical protein
MKLAYYAIPALFSTGLYAAVFNYPPPKTDTCTLQVLIETTQVGYDSREKADAYCEPFGDFCAIRKYDFGTWESHVRVKKVFQAEDSRDALDLLSRFLRRSRFINNEFVTTISFSNCRR